MKIRLILPATKSQTWVDDACNTYHKRLQAFCNFNIIELSASKHNKNSSGQEMRRKETTRLLEQTSSSGYLIACDEHGSSISTQALAKKISKQKDLGQNIDIIIGGADGLDAEQIKNCDIISLSQLTMPQHIAKIVTIEQLYRAFTIINNHPYHRGS
jgi:23S rRNA (pseudouridine1915-N3)-methyltransferase